MMILASTEGEFLRGQILIGGHTDTYTHARRQTQFSKTKLFLGKIDISVFFVMI